MPLKDDKNENIKDEEREEKKSGVKFTNVRKRGMNTFRFNKTSENFLAYHIRTNHAIKNKENINEI
jgi:hypothetical protein